MSDTDPAASLLERFKALLPADDHTDDDEPRDVRGLKAELARVRELRRKDREELTGLKRRVEELDSGYQTALKKTKEEAAIEVGRLATTHQEERSLLAVGVSDAETIAEVRAVWSALDPAARPKTPGEYARTLQEAAKDPKKSEAIPRRLQGYFRPVETKAADAPDTEGKVTVAKDKASAIAGAKTVAELIKAAS